MALDLYDLWTSLRSKTWKKLENFWEKKPYHGLLFTLTHDQLQIPAPSHLGLIQTTNEMITKAENQLLYYISRDQAVCILL